MLQHACRGYTGAMTEQYMRGGACGMIYDPDLVGRPDFCIGEYAWWRDRDGLLGNAGGRGTVYFVAAESGQWALRHYQRGGLVGRCFDDHFIWLGEARSRPFCEWRLLAHLRGLNLPVPQPVAAIYRRRGLAYTGELVTARIAGAESLAKKLSEGDVGDSHWQKIGKCIRQFHDAGVCHADLTGNNILLDDHDKVHLLDFDRGGIRGNGSWKEFNLRRLHRSLHKISGLSEEIDVSDSDWQSLVSAYRG